MLRVENVGYARSNARFARTVQSYLPPQPLSALPSKAGAKERIKNSNPLMRLRTAPTPS